MKKIIMASIATLALATASIAAVNAKGCTSCHGADGRGMAYVAPNIREFTPAMVVNVLNHGKKGAIGKMPAFDRLNAKQKEAAAAYIISLSKGE